MSACRFFLPILLVSIWAGAQESAVEKAVNALENYLEHGRLADGKRFPPSNAKRKEHRLREEFGQPVGLMKAAASAGIDHLHDKPRGMGTRLGRPWATSCKY